MIRRPGVTLIEVLMAIFVMGVGLMSLLTLFPVGAISMAQAIVDDAAANAAFTAAAVAESQSLRSLAAQMPGVSFTQPPGYPAIDGNGPSYPMYVDPLGSTQATNIIGTIGAFPNSSTGIPRVNCPWFSTVAGSPSLRTQKLRWFSLLDRFNFDDNGAALSPDGGTTIQRESQRISITWAYMLHRPRASVPSVVDVSIVVYNKRPLLSPVAESTYQAAGDLGANFVLLNWNPGAGQEAPAIRKGNWILDASSEIAPATGALHPQQYGPIHSNFYRVLGVTNLSSATPGQGLLGLELDQTLKAPVTLIVVMDQVIEVFENEAGRKPS
jgi:prepilin-type N-terminal cleavage/methylation domain-containing protein